MGDPITTAIISTVATKVGGKLLGGSKKSGSAQAGETARLEQQRADEAAASEAERKKKAGQRTATGVIFGGGNADNQSTGIGNLGG